LNPYRIEGQKTGSFEICDQLGRSPDYHFIPVGNAGNITAYWKGYREYKRAGKISSLPRMMGFQAEGAAPIVRGRPVKKPETIATAIRIGNPASWEQAENARDASGGIIDMVSDEKILEAYTLLASRDAVFCEPASAASVAGLIKLVRGGYFRRRAQRSPLIVCILTGHGLKDPDRALKSVKSPTVVQPKIDQILKAIGL
ncbi:MAG: pyridoxal-phosphate dependent enzyme, partial [Candidatus Omnitrophota bacterium]